MKKIIILGAGCANCKKTFKMVEKYLKENGIDAKVIKDEDITSLLKYRIMTTPAVIIDDKVVHSGGIPAEKDIARWF